MVYSIGQNFAPDVLCQIFTFCRADLQEPYESTDFHQAPRNVSQVCRLWRNTCINTASLWAVLSFNFTGLLDIERRTSAVGLYLQRSAAVKLDINVILSVQTWSQDLRRAFGEIMTKLIEHRRRWRFVSFKDSLSSFPGPQSELHISDLPALEKLIVEGPFIVCSSLSTDRLTGLQEVKIRNLPLSPLTSKQISWVDKSCASLLQSAINLRAFTLSMYGHEPPDLNIANMPNINLPSLETLSLSSALPSAGSIMSKLTCPSLQSLEFFCHTMSGNESILAVSSVLGPSESNLVSLQLRVTRLGFDQQVFNSLLFSHPRLRKLELSHYLVSYHTLDILKFEEDTNAICTCPELELFTLITHGRSGERKLRDARFVRALTDMVLSRRRNIASRESNRKTLNTLCFADYESHHKYQIGAYPIPEYLSQQLAPAISEGLQVVCEIRSYSK